MPSQDQTFRAYYSSMADADLLKMAANKGSFVDVAQRVMTDELARRHLSVPAELPRPTTTRPESSSGKAFAKLARLLHR